MRASFVTFPLQTSTRTVQAAIRCVDCPWSAVHTGENAIEVSAFLRDLYQRHLAERHPDLSLGEWPHA
jgi:membrane-associated PAP2 superfamily phosphatase